MSGPWKACCLIRSAWVSGSIFLIFTKIFPPGPLSFPSVGVWGVVDSGISKVLLWGTHSEEGRLRTADQKGSKKAGLLFLASKFLHNNFLWMFRL